MKKVLIATVATLALFGCSAAEFSHKVIFGVGGRITCYSGGVVISDDYSTGRIESMSGSDGWYYVSTTRNELEHVSGQCVLQQRAGSPPQGFVPTYPGFAPGSIAPFEAMRKH